MCQLVKVKFVLSSGIFLRCRAIVTGIIRDVFSSHFKPKGKKKDFFPNKKASDNFSKRHHQTNKKVNSGFYLLMPESKWGSIWVKSMSSLTGTTNRNIRWICNLPYKLTGLTGNNDAWLCRGSELPFVNAQLAKIYHAQMLENQLVILRSIGR